MLPTSFRYSAVTPQLPKALNANEAVAHLREHVFYHAHQHAYWKARAKALEARLTASETPTLTDQRTTTT